GRRLHLRARRGSLHPEFFTAPPPLLDVDSMIACILARRNGGTVMLTNLPERDLNATVRLTLI
ncbi:hypothetical protein KQH22_31050, partial [Streptomyces sp. Vc714c-19]|uniref:hypothetical protein n=1 Tax=Streptomyces sp. Vc714c-19 TaxID=2841673 RepID=UPI002095D65F